MMKVLLGGVQGLDERKKNEDLERDREADFQEYVFP